MPQQEPQEVVHPISFGVGRFHFLLTRRRQRRGVTFTLGKGHASARRKPPPRPGGGFLPTCEPLDSLRKPHVSDTTPNRAFLRGFPATHFLDFGLCGRSRILVAIFGALSPHLKIPFPAAGA